MTVEEAARRLGVAPHRVAGVAGHPEGQVVTVAGGGRWLVSATVARPFVEEVDGVRAGEVEPAEEEPVRTTEPAPAPASRTRRVRKASS